MTKVTPFLMSNDQFEAAMAFYTSTFLDSEIRNVARIGTDGPITSAEFVIGGQFFMGYNGGPYFKFSEGASHFVDCKDQEEVDEYSNKLTSAAPKAPERPAPRTRSRSPRSASSSSPAGANPRR